MAAYESRLMSSKIPAVSRPRHVLDGSIMRHLGVAGAAPLDCGDMSPCPAAGLVDACAWKGILAFDGSTAAASSSDALRRGARPSRSEELHRQPRFDQFPTLDPVGL
jgi:hypothetical protein